MKVLKWVGACLAILFVVLLGVGSYLLGSEAVPESTDYEIDLVELRALAQSLPGDLPTEVRFETIATGELPRAFIMAGEGFESVEMARPVFQILSPDGSFVLIDAAYDRALHEVAFADQPYNDVAWQNLVRAMEVASQIVVTHEHSDHLGGAAKHPRASALAGQLRLTVEQLSTPSPLAPNLPAALLEQLQPLRYDDLLAIAPGVVLQKAAGHTPGSQMVFVTLASGQELLFIGDVVWNRDAITELKYRPRFVTKFFLGEDRKAVLDQLRALRNLYDTGEVSIVVSHDARTFSTADFIDGFAIAR